MNSLAQALKLYTQILAVFIGYVGGFTLLGNWLQERGSIPDWAVMVLIGVGFTLSMVHIYRLSTRTQTRPASRKDPPQ